MNKKKIIVSLLILAASAIFYLYLYSKCPIYGIITAMPSESSVFLENMQDKKTVVKNKVQYYVGNIAGKHVVLVVTGIGKINAAAITSRLIENYHPASIIFSGIAGSVNKKLKIGDIVIGESIYNAESLRISDDLSNDDLNLNNEPNQEYLWADAQLLLFAKSVGKNIKNMHIVPGLIATTDIFPPEFRQIKNLEEKKVDAVEMEGFAVLQVCWLFDTPCLVIRGVSNDATDVLRHGFNGRQYKIVPEAKKTAENNSYNVVVSILKQLPN